MYDLGLQVGASLLWRYSRWTLQTKRCLCFMLQKRRQFEVKMCSRESCCLMSHSVFLKYILCKSVY